MADHSPDIYRVAVFGGSFDPIHKGHIATAERAMEQFGLNRVLWVPAKRPPHKLDKELAPDHVRLAMTLLATMGHRGWQVLTLEFNREGPSYTYDTLLEAPEWIGRYLKSREDGGLAPRQRKLELYFIIGSDNLPGLPGWKNAEDVISMAQPIIAWRHGDPDKLVAELEGRLSTEALARVARGFMRLPPLPHSSTAIRASLQRGHAPVGALNGEVLEYIQEHGLYGWPLPERSEGEARAGAGDMDPAAALFASLSMEPRRPDVEDADADLAQDRRSSDPEIRTEDQF